LERWGSGTSYQHRPGQHRYVFGQKRRGRRPPVKKTWPGKLEVGRHFHAAKSGKKVDGRHQFRRTDGGKRGVRESWPPPESKQSQRRTRSERRKKKNKGPKSNSDGRWGNRRELVSQSRGRDLDVPTWRAKRKGAENASCQKE